MELFRYIFKAPVIFKNQIFYCPIYDFEIELSLNNSIACNSLTSEDKIEKDC